MNKYLERFCYIVIAFILLFGIINVIQVPATMDQEENELFASWSVNYETIDEITKDSELVALIKVKGVHDEYMIEESPMTEFDIEVERILYGKKEVSKELVVVMTGIDNQEMHAEVEGDPLLERGEEMVAFLSCNGDGTYRIVGGPSGRLMYDPQTETVTSFHLGKSEMAESNPDIALEVKGKRMQELVDELKNIAVNL